MKKVCLFFAVCAIILSLTACTEEPKFETVSALLNHMEGMWFVEEENEQKSYYIFQEGKIYVTSDGMYTAGVERILSDALRNGGLNAWPHQDFTQVTNRLSLESFSYLKNEDTVVFPEKGEIIFNQGESSEERIVITEDSVTLRSGNKENGKSIKKLSDTADFSSEHFSELFADIKKDYKVSSKALFCSPASYVNSLKELHPYIDSFKLVSKDGDSTIHTLDGNLINSGASLIVDSDSVMFSEGKPVEGKGSPFVVMYEPGVDCDQWLLFICDRRHTTLSTLLKYTEPVLRDLPGALGTAELLSRFEKEKTVSGGVRNFETKIKGITYEIMQTTNDKTSAIYIKVDEYLQLPEQEANNTNTSSNSSNASANSNATDTLSEALDFSKVWKIDFTAEDVSGTFHYVFSEDGTCYVVLSDGNWPWGGGTGTYRINGNAIDIQLSMDGCLFVYSYEFDPQTYTLTHTSGMPVFSGLAATGDKYLLEEDDANEVDKIKEMAQGFADNVVVDDGI